MDLPKLLSGSDELLTFLQAELLQLEAVQGYEDTEARDLLQKLEQQTHSLLNLSKQQLDDGPTISDVQLLEQIDNLDAQLAELETSISSADDATMQLLQQSASKWLQPQPHAAQHVKESVAHAPEQAGVLSQHTQQQEQEQQQHVHTPRSSSSSSQPGEREAETCSAPSSCEFTCAGSCAGTTDVIEAQTTLAAGVRCSRMAGPLDDQQRMPQGTRPLGPDPGTKEQPQSGGPHPQPLN